MVMTLLVLLARASTTAGRASVAASPPGASSAPGPVAAETYLWRAVAIGGGGFVTGMASDPAGLTRLVRTDVGGAYRWDAAEDRWTQVAVASAMPIADRVQNGMSEGAYEIAVAPSDAKRVYMVIRNRVYRSDTGGATWGTAPGTPRWSHRLDPNGHFRLFGPFMAVSPDDPDLLLLGTPEDGLWRSSDGALSWTRADGVPQSADLRGGGGVQAPGTLVWFVPKGAGGLPGGVRVIAAAGGHGLFGSGADGVSFTALTPGTRQPLNVARLSTARDGSVVAVDREGSAVWMLRGGRWSNLVPGVLPSARYVGVAANPASDQIFVTDDGGHAWCSADRGAHWTQATRVSEPGDKEPPWLRIVNLSFFASGQIAFDPAVKDRLWVASGTGPYVADTGGGCAGLVWRSQVRGIEEIVASDVMQRPGRAPLFAGWDFGIHRKPDLNAFSTTYGPKERVLIAAQQLDWSPSNPDFVVTNASDTRMDCCAEDGDAVLAGYSLDSGASWRKFATLPHPPGTTGADPWRMAFGSIAVSADSIDNIVWEPAFGRAPFYTLDRGAHWARVVLPGETLPLTGSFLQFYAARKNLAADRVRPGTFYLAHSGDGANAALVGLWRTSDGGRHWTRVFEGEVAPNSQYTAKLRAVPGQAGHLFFTTGVDFGTDTRLRRSEDGGATWKALDGVDRVDDVAFGKAARGTTYPAIFISGRVGGRYGIWRSVDRAATWHRVAGFPLGRLDQVTAIEADKDVFGRVYVGYKGSGWLYGEPAPCTPAAPRQRDDRECYAL